MLFLHNLISKRLGASGRFVCPQPMYEDLVKWSTFELKWFFKGTFWSIISIKLYPRNLDLPFFPAGWNWWRTVYNFKTDALLGYGWSQFSGLCLKQLDVKYQSPKEYLLKIPQCNKFFIFAFPQNYPGMKS